MRLTTEAKDRGCATWEFLGTRAELLLLKSIVEKAIISGEGATLFPDPDVFLRVRRDDRAATD